MLGTTGPAERRPGSAETPGPWRAVGASMAAGASYDTVFGLAILLAREPAARILRLDLPPDPTYLTLNGIFLLMLGAFYTLAAIAPERYQGVVLVAIGGRLLGGLFFLARAGGGVGTHLWLGLGDLVFASVHAALLWRARGVAARPV